MTRTEHAGFGPKPSTIKEKLIAEVEQRRRDSKNAVMEIRKLNRQLAAKEQRIQKILALGDRTVLHLTQTSAKCQHAALLKDWNKECG